MESLDEKIARLPKHLQQQVIDFVDFLLHRTKKRETAKLTLAWAGGLREYRDKYTSLELQHKALEWRG